MTIEADIASRLQAALSPAHLEVINESSNHNVAPGSETHFKVVAVSEAFAGKTPIERHRTVNALLSDDAGKLPVHALSIVAKTPAQWEKSGGAVGKSPPCLGGGAS